ncbi:MAG: hypothetical protein WD512_14615 [Candidatus Paceibacterota bacterium]
MKIKPTTTVIDKNNTILLDMILLPTKLRITTDIESNTVNFAPCKTGKIIISLILRSKTFFTNNNMNK